MDSLRVEKSTWWYKLSILKKIQYSIIAFAFLVLVITAISLSQSANSHFHQSTTRELTVLSQVLADNSRAALTFNDQSAAASILSAVSKNPDIISAVLYKDNKVFASYPLDAQVPELNNLMFDKTISVEQGNFSALAPINVNDNIVGWIKLQSKLNVWELVWLRFLITFAGLVFAVAVLTVFMSYWLKKHITLPLRGLSEWATSVYLHKNFKARAIKRSDDEIGQLADSLNAMLTELSKQESIISLNHSLTAEIAVRKQTEQELISMRDRADQANRSKSDFLANMSHEIRTPMNAIIGFVDIVLEGDLDQKQSKHLMTVRNSAKDLHNLLNDILDVAKLEAGKVELENAPFSVKKLLGQVIKTFELKAKDKGLLFFLRIAEDLPTQFLGDALRLKQVLMNLIGNAVKFTASGSITIAVEQINQEQLQFIIRDTGIGIAKDKLEHIFESFNQADTSTSRKYGGTGLGTTISKRLVELMGGKIWLESDEGVGTTFYFTVNVMETKQKVKKVELLNIDSSLLKTERPLNVLAAEDGEQNAELLKIRLEALGHNFIRAVNGLEAVNLCRENNLFDIILMDVQMPIMDGLQATEQIRQLPSGKDIPIIALTASVMHEDRKACFAAGMDGFVKKPIVFNELFTEMAKLLPQYFEGAPKEVLEVQPELPDVPYINFQKGVNTWACADVYTKNLKQFARLHHSDMNALQRHIENGDVDIAEQLIHALKGTAGNLALVDLYDELLIMHGYLKRRNITAAHEHIAILTNTFEESLLSIDNLDIKEQFDCNTEALNMTELTEHINVQITRLSNGEFDEEQIGALLHQLTLLNCSEEEINRLRTSIDNFDFDLAVQVLTDILPNSE